MCGRTIILVLLAICVVQAIDQWAFKVEYHHSINFTCSSLGMDPDKLNNLEDITWILPYEQLLRADAVTTGRDNVKLLNNGTELHVNDVDDVDFGTYYCIAKLNGEDWVIKKGININGPYFGDLMLKYSPQAKTAALAACIAFLIASSICYIYDRNQGKDDRASDEVVLMAKRHSLEKGVVNPALNMTEVEYENTLQPSDTGKRMGLPDDVDTHF